ncbi:T0139272 isoform 3 [Pan troglodytes]|uniref:T0139272 isoform 3 n=1 Tax=Pan troglodytes TaxID=9598 RepID=A0A2J8KCA2_PANTR|nr:T0139272 isoform 3 [Pan troglodytes]
MGLSFVSSKEQGSGSFCSPSSLFHCLHSGTEGILFISCSGLFNTLAKSQTTQAQEAASAFLIGGIFFSSRFCF